jgi:hypothetical protein
MGRMPGLAKVVRSTIAMLRFPGVVTVPRPLLHRVSWVSNYTNFSLIRAGTLPTTSLIIKQVVPYRIRGDTCYPGVSTPKTRS